MRNPTARGLQPASAHAGTETLELFLRAVGGRELKRLERRAPPTGCAARTILLFHDEHFDVFVTGETFKAVALAGCHYPNWYRMRVSGRIAIHR